MRLLVVSGIWPPDVGGPASHAPDVADFLNDRGHRVEVVVTASGTPAPRPYPVLFTSRRLPVGVRHLHGLQLIARRALRAEVVYTTGMFGRSGFAAMLTRTPFVIKLTGDPAFERLRSRGVVNVGIESFQRGGTGLSARALKLLRDFVLRRSAHVFTPSSYLRDLVIGWGVDPGRVSVLPNPAPRDLPTTPRYELRRRFGIEHDTLVFAGRLTAQKSLGTLLDATAGCRDVHLVIAGDGEERANVEEGVAQRSLGNRVRLLGAVSRETVLELFAAADASVLASRWENFPHTVVEALAVGTPVIATSAGGVPEVVRDGENGLLVPVGDAAALAGAIRRFFAEPELQKRLRAGAGPSVAAYGHDALLVGLERTLEAAAK